MASRIIIIVVVLVLLLAAAGGAAFFLLGGQQPGETGGQGGQQQEEPEEEPGVPVIIAAIDIPANTVITDTETLLTEQEIPESDFEDNSSQYLTSMLEIEDKLLTRSVNAGRPILRNDLITPGLSRQIPPADDEDEPAPKAYPLEVDNLSGVADQITPGDFVDVIATYGLEQYIAVTEDRIETSTFYTTKTVVQQAEVLRIIRPASGAPSEEGAETAPGADVQPPPEEPQVDEQGRPIPPNEAAGAGNITQGTWTIILAVSNQEAEVLQYTRNELLASEYALALRSADDDEIEDTLGVTLNILYRDFDVPVPGPAGVLFDFPDQ
jgi:pilus assembly protein CpaB